MCVIGSTFFSGAPTRASSINSIHTQAHDPKKPTRMCEKSQKLAFQQKNYYLSALTTYIPIVIRITFFASLWIHFLSSKDTVKYHLKCDIIVREVETLTR